MAPVLELLRTGLIGARNVLLGANTSSLRMLPRPSQLVIHSTELLFYDHALRRARGLIEARVTDVLESASVIDVSLVVHEDEWFARPSPSFGVDLVSLCLLCRTIKLRKIFEIGTFHGVTALHLALNSPEAEIFTLDLPGDQVTAALGTTLVDRLHITESTSNRHYFFAGTDAQERIHCLFGDSATFDFRPYHRQIDLFFIDGAHSYDYVRSDTLNALDCCRPGGVIAWHDFGRHGVNGVSKWLRQLARSREIYVVPGGSLAFCIV